MGENVQDILWIVVVATFLVGYGVLRIVWRISKRDSDAKRRRSVTVPASGNRDACASVDRPLPSAGPMRDDADGNRLGIGQILKFVFLPGRKNRVLALEVSNFITTATVSEAESRVAGQLGIEPFRLIAERRYLLAGAIRSILVEFENRGNLAAASTLRQLLDEHLHRYFVSSGKDAEASNAGLESAFATYGMAERPKVALAFFRSLRGDAASADDMGRFPDFLQLFDNYAKDIEAFLRPRIAKLSAR